MIKSKVNGVIGRYLYGWVYFKNNLHQRVVLEIYADNQSLGVTIANIFEEELEQKQLGDACYGFVFKFPSYLLKNKKSIITIKIANIDYWLPTLPPIHLLQNKRNTISSVVHYGLRLIGWVWKPLDPDYSVEVSVYYKHLKLCTVVADKFTPYAEGMDKKSLFHGFEITLPMELGDGKKHTIRLYDNEGYELTGSPILISEYKGGIQKLLIQSKTSNSAYTLLKNIILEQQQYFPSSIPMEYYTHWYKSFGKLEKIELTTNISFNLCIIGKKGFNKTYQSLQKQNNKNWKLISENQLVKLNDNAKKEKRKTYIAFIMSGDCLSENILSHLSYIISKETIGLLYTDNDQYNKNQEHSKPLFKPDWNYEYFLEFNYIGSFFCVRSDLIRMEDSNDYMSILYNTIAVCIKQNEKIKHYAKIGYHQQYISNKNKNYHLKKQQKHLQNLLNKIEKNAIAKPNHKYINTFYINREIKKYPLISLIIPTKDKADLLELCLNSLIEKTVYPNIEIIVVNNLSVEKKTYHCLEKFVKKGVKVIDYNKIFNYSAINNYAVKQAEGDIIGLINNDIEVITPTWLENMLALLLRPNIGAVGAKLLWKNEIVQHGGVVLGIGGLAGHFGNYLHEKDAGYMNRNQTSQELSAVTAACLLVRKKDYWAVGGLNEFDFPVTFNDVDFCLKLREKGLRNIWCAHAKLWHYESASRGQEDTPAKRSRAYREQQNLKKKWGHLLAQDPYYNQNLNLDTFSAPFSALRI